MASNRPVSLNMPGIDPVDHGFRGHVAVLTGLKNREDPFHIKPLFRVE
jgi:hypothetical protein